MPVRSLNSSVLVWPDRATVDRAVRAWAASIGPGRHDGQRIGYFGSYARGDWGVGSDLDLIAASARLTRRLNRAPFTGRWRGCQCRPRCSCTQRTSISVWSRAATDSPTCSGEASSGCIRWPS